MEIDGYELKKNIEYVENNKRKFDLLNNIYNKPDKVIIKTAEDSEDETDEPEETMQKSYSERMSELLKDFPKIN